MTTISRAIEMVQALIPDLDRRISQFEVETFEMDQELIAVFCGELERVCGELSEGLAAADQEQVRVAAHSMKGMGGTMGLPEISVLAYEIELQSRAGALERVQRLCDALIRWSNEFVAANR